MNQYRLLRLTGPGQYHVYHYGDNYCLCGRKVPYGFASRRSAWDGDWTMITCYECRKDYLRLIEEKFKADLERFGSEEVGG